MGKKLIAAFQAGRNGLPMPKTSSKGTGTIVAITAGASAGTGLIAFALGRWAFPKQREQG